MPQRLRTKHIKAAQMLASGQPASSIEYSLRLRRGSVARWQACPQFMAEFGRVMEDRRRRLRYRLLQLAETSLKALEGDMDSSYNSGKRAQMALNMLKMLGSDQFALQCVPEESGPESGLNAPENATNAPEHAPDVPEHA